MLVGLHVHVCICVCVCFCACVFLKHLTMILIYCCKSVRPDQWYRSSVFTLWKCNLLNEQCGLIYYLSCVHVILTCSLSLSFLTGFSVLYSVGLMVYNLNISVVFRIGLRDWYIYHTVTVGAIFFTEGWLPCILIPVYFPPL